MELTRVCLVIGDWSGDGHMQTETFMFDVNMSQKDVEKAFRQGCKKIGLKCHDRHPEISGLFEEYEDCSISDDIVSKCAEVGINVKEHFASEFEEEELLGTPENYADFWMAVAKLGDPTLEYTVVIGGKIFAGGYGLFC